MVLRDFFPSTREEENAYRNNIAYAGAGLYLKGYPLYGAALTLASQALYGKQLLEVHRLLEEGDWQPASFVALAYVHHPFLEKREPLMPKEGGWKPLWEVAQKEGFRAKESSAFLEMIYTAHLGELTALMEVYNRRGFGDMLRLAQAISENRPLVKSYGLDRVTGPVKGRKDGV